MSTSSINQLANNYLSSILGNGVQGTPATANGVANSGNTGGISWPGDNGQISSFAQVLMSLQQLQQSSPAQYQQVTQQVATNLQNAAQTATTDGDSTAANQLNQLATDFSNASKSGQLPNIADLAQAIGGGHHHHHGHHAVSSNDPDANSSTSSTSTTDSTNSSSTTNPFLAVFQANSGQQNSTFDPLSIIANTLASAGVTTSATGS